MDISYYTVEKNLDKSVGYGNAGFQIVQSLQRLGHKVPFDDPEAPVQISFCNPTKAKFHPGQYKIRYTPWESTVLPHGWLEAFNDSDEVWATSPWVADVYKAAGVTVPIHIFEHGISEIWKAPKLRERGEKLKFLHMGEPAPRKGGQLAFDAFKEAFGDREDVHLTMKGHHFVYVYTWRDGEVAKISEEPNVTVLTDHLFESEMLDLILDHDVLIYPTYGEGFGLIPLQALATAMPVATTIDWCPYRQFVSPIMATPHRSPWFFHPGDMYFPDFNSIVDNYRWFDAEFEREAKIAYESIDTLYRWFDWDRLTENAFEHIVERFTEK